MLQLQEYSQQIRKSFFITGQQIQQQPQESYKPTIPFNYNPYLTTTYQSTVSFESTRMGSLPTTTSTTTTIKPKTIFNNLQGNLSTTAVKEKSSLYQIPSIDYSIQQDNNHIVDRLLNTSNQRQTALLRLSSDDDEVGDNVKSNYYIKRSDRAISTSYDVPKATSKSLSSNSREFVEDEGVDVSESTNRVDNHNPDCVLILKRTYILKNKDTVDEWGDKFVFNDVDDNHKEKKKKIHKSDLCIKRMDVDKAIEEAKHKMKFKTPQDIDSLEVSDRSISQVAELNLATGQLLTKKFDLTHDEILNALPMIDMSTSKLFWKDLCPKHVRPMTCFKHRYRTITAHCNNLKHPSWGATKTPYSRYLPPDYADGLTLPRASQTGEPLPSARLISSIVHRDHDEPSNDYSTAFASWGQILNHDVTRAAIGEAPDCCPQYLKGLCMPIPVPLNDPLYSKFNVKCLKFDRSLAAIRPKCLLGLRAQINSVTSPVDASFVYGSTKALADRLRKKVDGKMKVLNYFEKLKLKPLLPPKTENPDQECIARPKNLFCFEAGDVRVNEQTQLTVLHTVYVREHNRIAKQLAEMNIDWDDDKIYEETRHIVAACVQHIMVNEFLPLLLGHKYLNEYKIKPNQEANYWNGYDPTVTTSTGTGFAAAAFRYGHSMVEGVIKRIDKNGHFIKGELLRFLFKRPFLLYEPGVMDQLIIGMVLTPTEQTDPYVSEELSGHLFQPPKAKFGHDLAAINIQRGKFCLHDTRKNIPWCLARFFPYLSFSKSKH